MVKGTNFFSLSPNDDMFDSANAEFLGTYEREGQLCDYYQVSNEIETYFYYVLRSEKET